MQRSICPICPLLIVILLAGAMHAQQTTQFSQYMLNKYQLNPAYAGMDYSLSVTGVNRNQWSGFEGRPVTQNVNAHMPFYLWNGAFGINLENEKIGAQKSTSGSLSFNYVYDSPYGLFSAGLRLGIMQMKIDGSQLRSPEGIYEGSTIEHNDPILLSADFSGTAPIWEIGFYYIYDNFEGGISIRDIPEHIINLSGIGIKHKNLVNIYLEYQYDYNELFTIAPAFLFKSDFIQSQIDFSAIVSYNKKYFGGAGIRGYDKNSFDAIVLVAGIKISGNYRFSYSYDFGIGGLRNYNDGTHEFILNYNLNKLIGAGLAPKVIYNPRFL